MVGGSTFPSFRATLANPSSRADSWASDHFRVCRRVWSRVCRRRGLVNTTPLFSTLEHRGQRPRHFIHLDTPWLSINSLLSLLFPTSFLRLPTPLVKSVLSERSLTMGPYPSCVGWELWFLPSETHSCLHFPRRGETPTSVRIGSNISLFHDRNE